ncbi:TPA: EexN family lipoprotein [Proteus mirabilis]|uniref:EexN family lipoprotein n=1 Tax=Klebsiella pneumoniae TaxID=573 RepID=UPI000937867B|nr:EexN family lipoprotein [Klebsiella pneumoniae]EJJ8281100.1 EexN family lipoprotein [Salmonella enterica]HBC6189616.1 EexN family lipoprotein [Proteus mirabilis]HDY2198217.1 EexN family lipoprotein [Escherichia coli]RNP36825.1 hypothetical protein BL155_00008985 [Klebsiella pneumoniae]HBC9254558.1 EexN family lipoprotein [Proteus mirabilis]
MKKLIILSAVVVSFFALTGCQEETKSVDWWTSHPKETTEKYKECMKTGEDTDNCKNVKRAALNIANYPPMNEIFKQEAKEVKKRMGL